MSTQYPLYIMHNSNVTVVVSPVLAYQYKEHYYNNEPQGFEFKKYTTRKAVQKLEKLGDSITLKQYSDLLMSSMGFKLRSCFNAIKKLDNISESDHQTLNALKFDTFVTPKGSYSR